MPTLLWDQRSRLLEPLRDSCPEGCLCLLIRFAISKCGYKERTVGFFFPLGDECFIAPGQISRLILTLLR